MGRTWCTEAIQNRDTQSWGDRALLHETFSFFNAAFMAGKNKSFFASIGLLLGFYPDKSLRGISAVMFLGTSFVFHKTADIKPT